MQVGISTASFFNKVLTENCFDVLDNMGVSNTEVFFSSYSETDKGFIDNLAIKKGSINVHSVHALSVQFEGQLFSRAQRVRDDAEIYFRRVLYGANVLGARYYTFHGPNNIVKSVDPIPAEQYADVMNELCEIAESYGVYLSQENVHYCYPALPEYFKVLNERCPNLRFTLDLKHSFISGRDFSDYINAMGDKISTVHAVDITSDKSTCLPGNGSVNFERLFKELDMKTINPCVLIEAYHKNYMNMDELKKSYLYLYNLIK